MTLSDFFSEHPKAALGLSGGVDSSYLLYAGLECGADLRPYFIKTPFQPDFELRDAKRLTLQLGVSLTVIELDILSVPHVADNPPDRCYHCKHALFTALGERAAEDGYDLILDGSNADDDVADRPGMLAAKTLGVLSPLRECGLTKQDIRRLSKKAGLFTHDKPAYACLATRVPTGDTITAELLHRIESAENALYSLGFSDLRVRVFRGAAKIQLKSEQLSDAIRLRGEIMRLLTPYFDNVFLDMETR